MLHLWNRPALDLSLTLGSLRDHLLSPVHSYVPSLCPDNSSILTFENGRTEKEVERDTDFGLSYLHLAVGFIFVFSKIIIENRARFFVRGEVDAISTSDYKEIEI